MLQKKAGEGGRRDFSQDRWDAISKGNSFLCKECHVLDFHPLAEMVYTEAQKNLSVPWGKAFLYEKSWEDVVLLGKRREQTYCDSSAQSCMNFSSLLDRKTCSSSCHCLPTSPISKVDVKQHFQWAVKSVSNWNPPTEQGTKWRQSWSCGKLNCSLKLSGTVSNCH